MADEAAAAALGGDGALDPSRGSFTVSSPLWGRCCDVEAGIRGPVVGKFCTQDGDASTKIYPTMVVDFSFILNCDGRHESLFFL